MLDAVVSRKDEPVDTIKTDDSGIETPEYIVLDPDIPVIPALPTLGNAASYGYAGTSPAQTAVIAILEHVIAYRHVAHPGLLESVIAVALEQNRGPGYMEVIALDNDPSPEPEQKPARPVSRHPATANEDFGIILVGRNQMTFACTFGQRLGKRYFRRVLIDPIHALDRKMRISLEIRVIDYLDTHSQNEKIHAILPRMPPAQQRPVRSRNAVDRHVQAMNIRASSF